MDEKVLAALIAFLGGAVISLINAVITAKQAASSSESMGNTSLIRQILSMVYLTATYFVVRKLGIDYLMPMVGAAVGLTVPSILFAITIAGKMKGDE